MYSILRFTFFFYMLIGILYCKNQLQLRNRYWSRIWRRIFCFCVIIILNYCLFLVWNRNGFVPIQCLRRSSVFLLWIIGDVKIIRELWILLESFNGTWLFVVAYLICCFFTNDVIFGSLLVYYDYLTDTTLFLVNFVGFRFWNVSMLFVERLYQLLR